MKIMVKDLTPEKTNIDLILTYNLHLYKEIPF